jgi:hypothetical protein
MISLGLFIVLWTSQPFDLASNTFGPVNLFSDLMKMTSDQHGPHGLTEDKTNSILPSKLQRFWYVSFYLYAIICRKLNMFIEGF